MMVKVIKLECTRELRKNQFLFNDNGGFSYDLKINFEYNPIYHREVSLTKANCNTCQNSRKIHNEYTFESNNIKGNVIDITKYGMISISLYVVELEEEILNEIKKSELDRYQFDIVDIRDNEDLTDFKLITEDYGIRTEHPCHKLILMANSVFFQKIFKQNEFKDNKGELIVEKVGVKGVEFILDYMYDQEISDTFISVIDKEYFNNLFELCDSWQIKALIGYLAIKKEIY